MELTPGLRRTQPADLESVGEDVELVARIADEIVRDGPMTFARFMELALYDPLGGYYRGAEPRPGRAGDFLTAPEAHPIFGRALARTVAETWRRLGEPSGFTLREYGAGTGALGAAILGGLAAEAPAAFTAVRYAPLEVEPRRLAAIETRFAADGLIDHLVPGDGSEGAPAPIEGVVLANEVLDALPTHRVIRHVDGLREVFVGWEDGRFVDVEGAPSTPALVARLAADGVALEDGQRGEICLAADGWVADVGAGLRRGLLLAIDYGHPAPELYDPRRRRDGTLRAYLLHQVHDDPYIHVGRQDLTAHVDVSAVERSAGAAGLAHLGTTTQAEFLAGSGAGELLATMGTDPATTMEDYLTARSALLRMLDPAAMGRFRVMGFGRDWPGGTHAPPLAGFAFRMGRPGS
jgi:SAM-dependent MidA family methyltransferase